MVFHLETNRLELFFIAFSVLQASPIPKAITFPSLLTY